jgi:hypothetical protein
MRCDEERVDLEALLELGRRAARQDVRRAEKLDSSRGELVRHDANQDRDPFVAPRSRVDGRVVQIQTARRNLVAHDFELAGEIEILFDHELQRGVGFVRRDDRHHGELRQRYRGGAGDVDRAEHRLVGGLRRLRDGVVFGPSASGRGQRAENAEQ